MLKHKQFFKRKDCILLKNDLYLILHSRLESLENPAKPPIIMYAHGGHWDKFKRGLEPADQEIVDRLRKLKGEDSEVSPPSVEDIKRRLALLKDQDPESNVKPIDVR